MRPHLSCLSPSQSPWFLDETPWQRARYMFEIPIPPHLHKNKSPPTNRFPFEYLLGKNQTPFQDLAYTFLACNYYRLIIYRRKLHRQRLECVDIDAHRASRCVPHRYRFRSYFKRLVAASALVELNEHLAGVLTIGVNRKERDDEFRKRQAKYAKAYNKLQNHARNCELCSF